LTVNKLLVKKNRKEKIRRYIEQFTYLLRRSEVGKNKLWFCCQKEKGYGTTDENIHFAIFF
jgi:hypothetical protein